MGGVFKKPVQMAQQQGVIKKVEPAPTQAEVSQSTTMDQDGYDGVSRKTKRRGRSATIITGPTGVQEDLTLGKKSLLGS